MLAGEVRADLERILIVDVGLGSTRLEQGAKDASASAVEMSIEKLLWLWAVDAHNLELSALPKRRRFLA